MENNEQNREILVSAICEMIAANSRIADFEVVCDRRNNNDETIANRELRVDIIAQPGSALYECWRKDVQNGRAYVDANNIIRHINLPNDPMLVTSYLDDLVNQGFILSYAYDEIEKAVFILPNVPPK